LRKDAPLISGLIKACRDVIAANVDYLCALDSEIGDGDHGTNMRRGCEAIYARRKILARLPMAEALEEAGRILVENVGGASGPLYGTLLIEIGRQSLADDEPRDFPTIFKHAVDTVARRGHADIGDKTLLDVLYPIHTEVVRRTTLARIAEQAERAACDTVGMKAMRGRAKFLGERSVGHRDPGASSCALLAGAVCTVLMEQTPR
jgi:dihydroxyacetone kinase-like protein